MAKRTQDAADRQAMLASAWAIWGSGAENVPTGVVAVITSPPNRIVGNTAVFERMRAAGKQPSRKGRGRAQSLWRRSDVVEVYGLGGASDSGEAA